MLTSSLHTSHSILIFAYFQYSIWDIPFLLSVVNYFRAMLLATHASSELRDLNYDNFCIENVYYIRTTFNGDVLFELLFVGNLDSHSGQMQRMDRKHDGHAWCKAKTTNMKNDLNLIFQLFRPCLISGCNFFLFKKCKNDTTWISDVVHNL
jgi:hypothetical protein